MNVFRLLVAAIVAVALMYVVYTQFAPLFGAETKIGAMTEGLLLEAQGDLGHAKGTNLTLKAGQSLYARNLDTPTRTVALACSTPDCCPFQEDCTKPITVTGDRLFVNSSIKASITARCEEVNDIHACKVYIGNEPAQVILESVSVQENITINGSQELPVIVTIRNTGENPAANLTIKAELLEEQTVGANNTPVVIQMDEETIPSLASQKNQTLNMGIPIQQLGTFTVRVRVSGEDAGMEEKEYTIHVTGIEADLCARDMTQSEAAYFDALDNVCRKKVFCSGCAFTYQCRAVWEMEAPISGVPNGMYDPSRGEPGFAFQTWTQENGTC